VTYIGPAGAWDAIAAAGGDWDVTTMVAIAGAESGWDTTARSSTNDWGLLQINLDAWPELFQRYQWDDPGQNAQMAHHVWLQQGYRAWVTYWQGTYRRYLDQAAAASGGGGGVSDAAYYGAPISDTPDWSGWDFSQRVSASGKNLFDGFASMSYQGSAIRSLIWVWG
jgi:Transglycosylase SLT domain